MTADRKAENGLRLFLEELGPSKAVETFLRNYGNVRTRNAYAGELCLYFRWLRGKGIDMTPDQLIQDNLRAVFESRPTDVTAKRRHTDLLGDYINTYLIVQRGDSEAKRSLAAAAIRGFYSSNDSQLFGQGAPPSNPWRLFLNIIGLAAGSRGNHQDAIHSMCGLYQHSRAH